MLKCKLFNESLVPFSRLHNVNMKILFLPAVFLICFTVALNLRDTSLQKPVNLRPVIGILAQELSSDLTKTLNITYKSYIAASYVKYVEGAGARVVPIFINKDQKYYKKLMYSINGVLFPGGAVHFEDPDGYAAVGEIIYQYALKMNDNGDYFPLWGTCLGFELMTYLAANQREHRCDCWSNNQALPLEFTKDFLSSKLFGSAPKEIIEILSSQPVTPNFHQYCVTEKNMSKYNLLDEWHILANNRDLDGLEFVSAIESRYYPFYSLMAHPEKNGYEWKINKNNPHTADAIKIMQYFANFFVNEDDIAIMSEDIIDLQHKRHTQEKYCKDNNLQINTKKTTIIIFSRGRKKKYKAVRVNGEKIEIVNNFAYLGIKFKNSGLFNEAVKSLASKARSALGSIWSIMMRTQTTNWDSRITFQSIVISIVQYSSGEWGLSHMEEIELKRVF